MENENVKNLTIFLNNIREDLQDELDAVKKYEAHADYAEKFGYIDEAKILRDISDEEKVHIGELSSILKKFDSTYEKSLEDGEKEANALRDENLEEDISYLFQEEDLKYSAKEKLGLNKSFKPIKSPTKEEAKEKLGLNKSFKPIKSPTKEEAKEKLGLKEAVTFIDNMGNLKTTSAKEYNAEMHKYDKCISIMNKLRKKKKILKETSFPKNLEDREYVFPKQKRFPLFDKAHVLAAIKFFNYAKPSEEEILSKKIKEKMKKYGLTSKNVGEENRLKKYL